MAATDDYTIMRRADAPDFSGGDPAGPFLGYGRPMGAEQIALNVRVLAPGATHRPPGESDSWGHRHTTIEEIYFVLSGEVRIRLNGAVETLGQYDAVRIPAGTVRAVRNETPEEAAFAMISVKVTDQRAESAPQPDFWAAGA